MSRWRKVWPELSSPSAYAPSRSIGHWWLSSISLSLGQVFLSLPSCAHSQPSLSAHLSFNCSCGNLFFSSPVGSTLGLVGWCCSLVSWAHVLFSSTFVLGSVGQWNPVQFSPTGPHTNTAFTWNQADGRQQTRRYFSEWELDGKIWWGWQRMPATKTVNGIAIKG